MSIDKKLVIIAAVWFAIGCICGFFMGKGVYDVPLDTDIKRDTTTTWDTIPDIAPEPKDSTPVRTAIMWLPMKLPKKSGTRVVTENVGQGKISVDSVKNSVSSPRDSVLVEVPITSKHYHAPEYDAYVSGYLPSLDSINVYQRTEYITERVTVSKPPNRFTIGLQGGYGYGFKSKQWEPYVGIGIGIKIF